MIPQVKDPVEAWADMEDMVRSEVAKARRGEEEPIEVNTPLLKREINRPNRPYVIKRGQFDGTLNHTGVGGSHSS